MTAIILLVAIIIQRVYGAEDCEPMTKCLIAYGSRMKYLTLDFTNRESIVQFIDEICIESNINSLVKCYRPEYLMSCTSLQNLVQYGPSQEKIKQQFIEVCSQKKELVDTVECLMKANVSRGLVQCVNQIGQSTVNYRDDRMAAVCSIMPPVVTCMASVMKGQCTDDAVTFFRSTYEKQLNTICSASKLIANFFLLCILVFIIQFYLC